MIERQLRDLARLLHEERVTKNDNGPGVVARHAAEAALDLIGGASIDDQHMHARLLRRDLNGV